MVKCNFYFTEIDSIHASYHDFSAETRLKSSNGLYLFHLTSDCRLRQFVWFSCSVRLLHLGLPYLQLPDWLSLFIDSLYSISPPHIHFPSFSSLVGNFNIFPVFPTSSFLSLNLFVCHHPQGHIWPICQIFSHYSIAIVSFF